MADPNRLNPYPNSGEVPLSFYTDIFTGNQLHFSTEHTKDGQLVTRVQSGSQIRTYDKFVIDIGGQTLSSLGVLQNKDTGLWVADRYANCLAPPIYEHLKRENMESAYYAMRRQMPWLSAKQGIINAYQGMWNSIPKEKRDLSDLYVSETSVVDVPAGIADLIWVFFPHPKEMSMEQIFESGLRTLKPGGRLEVVTNEQYLVNQLKELLGQNPDTGIITRDTINFPPMSLHDLSYRLNYPDRKTHLITIQKSNGV